MANTPEFPEPVVAVVVAAGSGVRLGEGLPKALRTIGGHALVAHSIRALAAGGATRAVVVARPELGPDFAAALADAPIPWTQVAGGAERQDSVAHGLREARRAEPGSRVVLVHDAARPFVPAAVVADVIGGVRDGAPAVIPAVPVVDTLRHLEPTAGQPAVVDRSALCAVQTPQGFDPAVLEAAHAHVRGAGIAVTDDASACEAIDVPVRVVAGSRESLKVTEPFDLVVAEAIWARRRATASDVSRSEESPR